MGIARFYDGTIKLDIPKYKSIEIPKIITIEDDENYRKFEARFYTVVRFQEYVIDNFDQILNRFSNHDLERASNALKDLDKKGYTPLILNSYSMIKHLGNGVYTTVYEFPVDLTCRSSNSEYDMDTIFQINVPEITTTKLGHMRSVFFKDRNFKTVIENSNFDIVFGKFDKNKRDDAIKFAKDRGLIDI